MTRLLPLALLAACDPHFTTYVRVHATAGGTPAAGAYAIALTETSELARLDQNGRGEFRHGGFLRATQSSPVVVYVPGRRAWVGVPPRDFAVKGRGVFYVTEFDATVDANLDDAPSDAGVPLRCGEQTCDALLPVARGLSCIPYTVVVNGPSLKIEDVSVQRSRPTEPYRRQNQFPRPALPPGGELFVVAHCIVFEVGSFVMVSDAVR